MLLQSLCTSDPISLPEAPDGSCEFGGFRIDTGTDTDDDILDPEEVVNTYFVCNGLPGVIGPEGPPGQSPLLEVSEEPPGPNCPNGGVKIETGIDANENGSLDESEVTDTTYVCNGERGPGGNGCALTASGSGKDALAGVLIFALLPLAVIMRRKFIQRRSGIGK